VARPVVPQGKRRRPAAAPDASGGDISGQKKHGIAPRHLPARQYPRGAARRAPGAARRAVAGIAGVLLLAVPARADLIGDAAKGAEVFSLCSGCHAVGPGAEDGIGPHLNAIFGREAGAHEGFAYSDAMERMGTDGLVWTLETLDAYVRTPRALVSKTRMSFGGLEDAQERADLLAYLRTFSDDPANIPEAAPTATPSDHDLAPDILALEGDPEYGAYLATECLSCHKADGTAEGIPSITRWPEEDFVAAMHAYKKKLRPHPVMQMMAGRLSNEEIAALAAYFEDLGK
jgi:cytochrome c